VLAPIGFDLRSLVKSLDSTFSNAYLNIGKKGFASKALAVSIYDGQSSEGATQHNPRHLE
jgi:hypothetical protein